MYIADIIVGTTSKGSAVLYDIVNIQSKKTVASPSHTAQSRRSDVSATNNSIRQNSEKSIDDVKNAAQNEILSKKQTAALRDRGVAGDDFLNTEDLAKEILSVGGTITEDGKVVLYHGTTAEAAAKIKESGKMVGKEPNLFFSTKKDGLILDYGKSVVEVQIPLEKLELNDIFDDELHLTCNKIENIISKIDCDILYLDPPYTQNQYGTQYHLLETLILDDNPSVSAITGSRPTAPMRSDWSKEFTLVCNDG